MKGHREIPKLMAVLGRKNIDRKEVEA